MAGIIQEQHADRCRLFMQWKEMDWPILVDSFNRLQVAAVPITLLIDEHGVIRKLRARPEDLEDFLETDYPKPEVAVAATPTRDWIRRRLQRDAGDAAQSKDLALDLVEWGDAGQLTAGIEMLELSKAGSPDDGWLRFRLGVAYRRRYDSAGRRDGDFAQAVANWAEALAIDPNQYIWRRRIQQYGPRLDKPYASYDWVPEARKAIEKRGGSPVPLVVEPGGAEFARPLKRFEARGDVVLNPDPSGRVARDAEGFIAVETTVVPATQGSSTAARVHLVFRPNQGIKAHWNSEAEGAVIWLDSPKGWKLERQRFEIPNDAGPVSDRPRSVEFEALRDSDAGDVDAVLTGYALYYACEDVDGLCVYRRLDFRVELGR
jgi:hypothetical protein